MKIYYLMLKKSLEDRLWDTQQFKKCKIHGIMDYAKLRSNAKTMQKWTAEKVYQVVC